jgi:2-oxoglutarate dehydrogenase E2 component (dihydrolipoamide succinyltransferase)
MAEIVIPSVGIAMSEALLVRWLKQPGDSVSADEPVAEIETDKATMELVSPVGGLVGPHLFEPGTVVPVGTAIVQVLAEGEAPAETRAADAAAPAATTAGPREAVAPTVGESGGGPRHAMSPRARRLARERGETAGTDPKADRFREMIAAKVAESWRQIPHFAVTREVDAEPMLAALGSLRERGVDPVPTLTDLLLHALALGLRECRQGDGSDVGLAVATRFGVVIPVVRGVLDLDPPSLARARSDAVQRAQTGRLAAEDLEPVPPSTLSNLGPYGVDQFTGIIAAGQTSLLTTGRAVPRVVVEGDGRTLQLRRTFHATLNADHRTVDGAEAARLLLAFAEAAESMTEAF